MAGKFDNAVVGDNLTKGMDSLSAASSLMVSPSTNMCGVSLAIGPGGGSITSHQWWILGGLHRTIVRAQKIIGDLDENNSANILVSIDPSTLLFERNTRVTKWRSGQFAIIASDTFSVQDGTDSMRTEVMSREWSYRVAIECTQFTSGCKMSLQTLPIHVDDLHQMMEQSSNALCVTRLARTQVEWLPAPHGYDHNGPWPLFLDNRNSEALQAGRLPPDIVIRSYIRETCMSATKFPSLSRQECRALGAGDMIKPPLRNPTRFSWPKLYGRTTPPREIMRPPPASPPSPPMERIIPTAAR